MLLLRRSGRAFWCGIFFSLLGASCAIADEFPFTLQLYSIKVNGQDMGMGTILYSQSAGYFARAEVLEQWGLNPVDSTPVKSMNVDYYPLSFAQGYRFKLDEANQELALEFDPAAFKPNIFASQQERTVSSLQETGGFLNYDFYGTNNRSSNLNQTQINGQFELGLFNRWGAGLSNFVGQNLYSNLNQVNLSPRLIRLETNWTRDFSEERRSLVLGDANGRSSIWGRPVKFAGIQFGTNFATQPGFVTIPLPAFTGEAALPSMAEVYINGNRQMSQAITPGPFQINNFPVITGSGEAKIVVKDMLGKEQVITQPFYLTPNLLRPGVEDYTVELGLIRNNFGLENANYGRPMLVGTQRRGLSDKLTTEWRLEVLPDQKTAGLAATYIPPVSLALTAAAAVSNSQIGNGNYFLLGVDHQAFGGINFGVRAQSASNHFTQLGLSVPGQMQRLTANMGFYTGLGSFGISYTYQKTGVLPIGEYITTSYSKSIGGKASVSLSLFSALSGPANQMVSLFLAYPLDNGIFASTNFISQQGAQNTTVQMQKSAPFGAGIGFRALAGGGQLEREEAGITLQTDYGTYIFDAGRMGNLSSYRFTANGSLALLQGKVLMSRRSYDSFVQAQVPGFANVPVYLNGQLAAHTDRDGYAILPGLPSYQKSRVTIDTKDLPIAAQIETSEAYVTPHYRSGVSLKFSVQLSIGALVRFVAENGQPLPNGTLITLAGSPDEFQVALLGEAYLTGLAKKNRIKASWNNQHCDIEVNLPENPGPLPHIGPVLCRGIQP
jgi:outer membrane usher protein